MSTVWQQLGGFIYTGANLSDDTIDRFIGVGGKFILPIVYGDDLVSADNRVLLSKWRSKGLRVGGAFQCFAKMDPKDEAAAIAETAQELGIMLLSLDCENEYGWPGGKPNDLPILASEVRRLLPTAQISINTNGGPDNSKIWNGRTLAPPKSMYDLKIRVQPQWYSSYYTKDGRTPVERMKWLSANGGIDFNFIDLDAEKTHHFGLPKSYVHAMMECTGEEGSDLAIECKDLLVAKAYGYTYGLTLYSLERAPDQDFVTLTQYRNILYLT